MITSREVETHKSTIEHLLTSPVLTLRLLESVKGKMERGSHREKEEEVPDQDPVEEG